MGFKSSKQGRQELPEMILQFMIDKMYSVQTIKVNWDSNPITKGDRSSLD